MVRTMMVVAMLAGQAGGVEEAPLKPQTPWSVNYAEDMCILSRDYGDKANNLTVVFRPTPFNYRVQTLLIGSQRQLGYGADAKVHVDGRTGSGVFDGDGQRSPLPKMRKIGVTFDLPRDVVSDIAGKGTVGFAVSSGRPLRVDLALTAAALKALRACETDLMQSWGFDVTAVDTAPAVPARALGDHTEWLRNSDFPSAMLGTNAVVTVAWIITPEGGIRNCRVVRSSGNATFDAVPCGVLEKRARYTPARDATGKAVETPSSRVIRFKS